MGHYHRLTLMEREELSRMLAAGASLRATAHALQRAPSTLSRELTRHRTSQVRIGKPSFDRYGGIMRTRRSGGEDVHYRFQVSMTRWGTR